MTDDQKISDKEKIELNTSSDFLSSSKDGNEQKGNSSPSPFSRPVESSPFARPSENSPARANESFSTTENASFINSKEDYSSFARPSENSSFARPSENSPFAPPAKDPTAGWPMNNSPRLKEETKHDANPGSSIANIQPPDPGNDQYKIIEMIGQGGMGTVYRAQDVKLMKEVAIKFIRPELATDQTALKRFYQECQTLSELNHPNIVAVYAVHTTATAAPYLVMAYIAGESLGSAIQNLGRMDVGRALGIFSDVLEALHYAHQRRVIHRDLKPSNILLSPSGAAHVVDFGIAKAAGKGTGETVTGLTQMGDLFGTPAYMSPEQCEGEPLDERSDIYSLGCVMYETLTGSPPFIESNPFKLMTKQVNEKAPSLEQAGFSRSLSNIIGKCLEKRKENRYQTVDELMQDITAVRNSKEPLNVRKKAIRVPQLTVTPLGLWKTALVMLLMLVVAYATLQFAYVQTSNTISTGFALTTGTSPIPSVMNPVPMLSVTEKPHVDKPAVKKPSAFPATPYIPITAPPLSEEQKEKYRVLLHNATANDRTTIEPLLEPGKSIIPFLLEEVRNPNITIARGSSEVLIELGAPALPGLIEDLKIDSNRWIKDAVEAMGNTSVAALSPLLTDADPQIRARALISIHAAIGDNILPTKLNDMILWLALNDPDAMVREAACAALAQSPNIVNVKPTLAYEAVNDPSLLVRTAAVVALGSLAAREGDTSRQTLDILGWALQKETTDQIKLSVLRSRMMSDYSDSLAPYLRAAYYTGSKEFQRAIIDMACKDANIGNALLPELIDYICNNEYGYSTTALRTLTAMKGRAKIAVPALSAKVMRLASERPSDTYYRQKLSDAIAEINRW